MHQDFTHSAFLYDSPEAYVAFLAPFIRAGLEQGEAVAMVAPISKIEAVRAALDPADAAEVRFRDSEGWSVRPLRTIGTWAQVLRTAAAAGRPSARLIHEIDFSDQTPSWVRTESAINTALAGFDGHLLCPYDVRVLPADLVHEARRTHHLLHEKGWRHSDDYTEPAVLLAEIPEPVFPAQGEPLVRVTLGDAIADLRANLRNRATAEEWLPPDRVEVLVLALSELATNGIRHGGDHRELRIWLTRETLVGEVTDDGRHAPDPLAGYLPPVPGVAGGMGLWLVGQICDALSVHTADGVTHARFALHRP